nr:reverse transcriptase domain-containing protein [Tanacetum cinerariifolium]
MVNPTIYVSCIKQFWARVSIKKVNDVVKLRALIDGKRVAVTEDVIRQALHLDDADGVDCFPNEEIFTELAHIAPKGLRGTSSVVQWSLLSFALPQGFFGVETPLFATMLVQPQPPAAEEEDEEDEGRIEAIDFDEDITLVDAKTQVDLGVELQGRKDDDNVTTKDASAVEPTIFDDEEMAKRLHDEEVEQVAAREKQEKDDLEKAKVLQQKYVDKQENIDWNVVVEQCMTYDNVRPIFDREYNKVQTLFKPDKDVEEPQKKRVIEETLLQKSFKKLKAIEVSEKNYPMSNAMMIMMLIVKLQVEEDSEMARDLVMKIFMEANKLKSRSLDTSSKMPPKRTSTSVASSMTQVAIRQLVADSVAAALEAQATNMANTDNTNRNPEPRETLTKMEDEFYHLTVKGNDLNTYVRRFQELATLCPTMVSDIKKMMEAFIRGLPRSIEGNVTASKPQILEEAINIARRLTD